jgi:hypothetical protein
MQKNFELLYLEEMLILLELCLQEELLKHYLKKNHERNLVPLGVHLMSESLI